jgi:hypothetical protein
VSPTCSSVAPLHGASSSHPAKPAVSNDNSIGLEEVV